jgi:16S rRNA (cytosine967-C5)-methyltransferase
MSDDEGQSRDDLRAHLLELYARVVESATPVDAFLAAFLRRRPQIRGKARNFLGAVLFVMLRARARVLLMAGWNGRLDDAAGVMSPGEEACLALYRWLREDMGHPAAEAEAMARTALKLARERVLPDRTEAVVWPADWPAAAAARVDGPRPWPAGSLLARAAAGRVAPEILERWEAQFDLGEAAALAASLGEPAGLDIRAAGGAPGREAVLAILRRAGVSAVPTPFAPTGIRLGRKVPLAQVHGLDASMYEVQDEGSQLVSVALGAAAGWRVLDACAGAGGKALHLAELVGPEGEVVAHDIDGERLERLATRPTFAGAGRIRLAAPGEPGEPGSFDGVLVDAPCLGMGRLRRDPMIPWRGSLAPRLAAVTALQRECLDRYAKMVRPGGVMVYATCSPETEETSSVVAAFLRTHPDFVADPLPAPFGRGELAHFAAPGGGAVWLLPSIHGTDGFFIARFRRAGG